MKLNVHIDSVRTKRFGDSILKDIHMEIMSPGLIWIKGANGSGKTVLSSIISGKYFIKRRLNFSGSIKFVKNNEVLDPNTNPHNYIENVAYLPQKLASSLLAIHHQDDLCFPCEADFKWFEGEDYKNKTDAVIAKLDELNNIFHLWIHAKKKIGECSYGETKRIEFACTVATKANIYVFDEPFSGLDPKWVRTIVEYMKMLMRVRDVIIIITSHLDASEFEFSPKYSLELNNTFNSEFINTVKFILNKRFNNKINDDIISLNQFDLYRNNNRILNIGSFNFLPGQLNWIEGPNGSGKSTLLHFISGILTKSRGKRIQICGNFRGGPFDGWPKKAPNKLSRVLLQNPYKSFIMGTLREDLEILRAEDQDLISTNFTAIDRSPYTFSFGQLRFFQLLLIPEDTDVILFDEPLQGLSPALYPIMLNILYDISRTGRYVFATSENDYIDIRSFIPNSNILNIPVN